MKKIFTIALLVIISIGLYNLLDHRSISNFFSQSEKIEGELVTTSGKVKETALRTNTDAKAMLVLDTESNQLLFKKNEEEPLAIASLTKMMSFYLFLNAIEASHINWEDVYVPSDAVLAISSQPNFAKLGMYAGHTYTVRELFQASVVLSANDATVALAEMVAGSEENFVRIMNEQAAYFDMTQTTFFNSTGLDGAYLGQSSDQTNHASAKDVATLAEKLIAKHPVILDYTSIKTIQTTEGVRETTNLMLRGLPYELEGIDGLKTGFTDEAGPCFVSTGVFRGKRIVTVVLGVQYDEENPVNSRFQLTKDLVQQFALK